MNEKRDKLIIEALGGCWHEWKFRSAAYMCSQESDYECENCNEWKSDQEFSSLSTPGGFFWAWNKAKEKEWWRGFLNFAMYLEPNEFYLINPDRFANALAEFLEGRK